MERFIPNPDGLNIHILEHIYDENQLYILCHGFTGSVHSHVISSIRSFLNDKRISNVSVDFTNNLNDSDGHFSNHTISGEVKDLETVWKLFRDRFQSIVLVGHSMGCLVSTEFSLRHPIDGMLLVAPPFSMKKIIREIAKATYGDPDAGLALWERNQAIPIYKDKHQASYPLSYEFYRDLSTVSLDFSMIQTPSVIIYSSADPVVPPRDSIQLHQTLGSPQKRIIPIDDAPHSFDTPSANQALLAAVGQSLGFLKQVQTS